MIPDPRLTPFSGRIALKTLGYIEGALNYVTGEPAQIIAPYIDLCAAPNGARDRQLLHGDTVTLIEQRDQHIFLRADKDGYCGWVSASAIADQSNTHTHIVTARSTHIYHEPRAQAPEITSLPMGARLCVMDRAGQFAKTTLGYVPLVHLKPITEIGQDPVSIAKQLIGAPYLWGGNTAFGIDCSGLVQIAHHMAGLTACPADSDQQRATTQILQASQRPMGGNLVFWKGHVALMVDSDHIIHANAHTMDVTIEPLTIVADRIKAASGDEMSVHFPPQQVRYQV